MSAAIPVFSERPKAVSTPKLRALVKFPGNIVGTTGIEVSKANGTVTIETDWNDFGAISSIPTSPTSYILTFDTATQAYVLVPAHLLGGAVAGIADAPNDGTQYGRQSGAWTAVSSTGGIADAPSNGTLYGRKNGAWTLVPAAGIADAPSDGSQYARTNGAWTVVVSGSSSAGTTRVITTSGTVTVAATDGVIAFNQTTPTTVSALLPTVASRSGLILSVEDVKGTAGTNPITITANGSEKIDGLTSVQIANAYGFFTLRPYAGIGWKIINSA